MAFTPAVRPFEDFFSPRPTWGDDDFWGWSRPRTAWDPMERMMDRMMSAFDVRNRRQWFAGDVQLTDKSFDVALDVRGYKPEELQVKVENGVLEVDAKHEEKSQDGSRFVARQFSRRYKLPDNVNLDAIKSSLVSNGSVLTVSAPLLAVEAPKETSIPVHVSKK